MKINVADTAILSRLLNRGKKLYAAGSGVDFSVVLKEILSWVNKLVPSESGSILLDDPTLRLSHKNKGRLYFSACFGKGSASLIGTFLTCKQGIASETYRSGKPYISKDTKKDIKFYPKIDQQISFKTMSIICAPITINGSTIGVIELINRKGKTNYDRKELYLLEIFAGYTATLVNNALLAGNFEELSKRDDLSGLYNGRYFFRSLEYEIGRALGCNGELSMIFFDLDHLKKVNDTYGHLAGSMVLKEIGDILRKIFRGTDAVMARYGGDEYVIILPDTNLEKAKGYAENIRIDIAANPFLEKKGISSRPPLKLKNPITSSVGVASLPMDAESSGNIRKLMEDLVRAADSAMYMAKAQGRNRVVAAKEGKIKTMGLKKTCP